MNRELNSNESPARNGAAGPAHGELTVLIPGLVGPDAAGAGAANDADSGHNLQAARALTEALPLPGLSTLLEDARDTANPFESPTADGLLAEAFNMPRDAQGQWCAGAVAREGALGDAQDRYWMRADPVHLHADMGRLILFPPPVLDLDLAESNAICEWMNSHEHFSPPRLAAVSGTCWLVEVDAHAAQLRTFPPSAVHGEDADRFLPVGEGAALWHARMNEMQMLLNQCPLNHARAARGAPVVNSVWFWGAGALPDCRARPSSPGQPPGPPYAQIHGNHDLLAGLSKCFGLRAQTLPGDGARWLHGVSVRGRHLLVLDDLQIAACAADVSAWRLALHSLDQRWLQSIADGLRHGVWQRITVHAGRGASVDIRRRGLTRWLRRRRELAKVLARLRQAQSEHRRRAVVQVDRP